MLQNLVLARRIAALAGVVLSMSFPQPGLSQTVNVLTQHNDVSRTGSNPNETILTTSNVSGSTFGKLFTLPVDGFTYAQPLYVSAVSIAGGTHNVLYVATAHDTVYAFDADSGTQYWTTSLGTPVPSSVINTQNILVEVGIISTPVIDLSTDTIYVVAKTYTNSVQGFSLHALNIETGAEKFGGPVQISASVAGSGMQSSGGKVPFVASQENQRASLTLANGVVYLGFASHEDYTPYHGWLLGYSASTLQQVQVFNVTPNSGQGAIWMGGQGLVVSSNDLYLITANSTQGTENASNDYGESFLKLVPNGNSLTVGGSYRASDYDYLNANDLDLGAGGAFAIPGTSYIAGGGKDGNIYVINTSNMGEVQEFQAENALFGSPAFYNNTLYIWGVNDPIKAYQFNGSTFSTTPSSQSSYSTPGGYSTAGTVSVSSNGTTAGSAIVWATAPTGDPDHATVGANMFAFNASNLGSVLWSTSYGGYAKYVAPTVANGKVYVGTDSGQVAVYGLTSTTCTATAIVPYISVAGVWSANPESAVTVAPGTVVNLGPQPITGGTWAWTGPNGFTSALRELDGIALSTGANVYTANYTNSCGAKSTPQAFTITVTGGSTGSFSLKASAASLSVAQGSSATDTITVTDVSPFAGSVTLAASGLPSGVTAAFATNPATATSVLTLTASSSAAAGASTVTITGTSGSLNATTTVALTVTSSSCTATAIVPEMNVGGVWTQESSATVTSTTAVVDLGPQPATGGTWAWTGPNGFTSTAREIDSIKLSTGANVYTATYTNASGCKSTQAFTITVTGGTTTLIANGTYIVTAVNSGSALDDPASSTTNGTDMGIWTVNDGTNQQWKVNNVSTNVITLTNVASGQLLDVAGASKTSGALVDQWPANGQTNQEWTVISVAGGAFELTSVNSGMALSVVGGGTANGTGVDQLTYSGGTSQQWKFTAY